MENENWLDEHFRSLFEDEMRVLERRRAGDPSLTIEDLEGSLQSLYSAQGADWEGRGPVADAAIDASIAAYEAFIERWKKEFS
ncbi:MAG: hypothetical protein IIW10_02685 [Spirochaetaceae bacterium]|nr:hypothetical protein [Spirochaetaceae bacterium]